MNFIKKYFCLLLFLVALVPFEEVKAQDKIGVFEPIANPLKCMWETNTLLDRENKKYLACVDAKRTESVQIQKMAALKFDELQKKKLAGAVTTPMDKLKEAAEGIGAKLVGFATNLFWFLVAITIAYQFGFMVLKRSDLKKFVLNF